MSCFPDNSVVNLLLWRVLSERSYHFLSELFLSELLRTPPTCSRMARLLSARALQLRGGQVHVGMKHPEETGRSSLFQSPTSRQLFQFKLLDSDVQA